MMFRFFKNIIVMFELLLYIPRSSFLVSNVHQFQTQKILNALSYYYKGSISRQTVIFFQDEKIYKENTDDGLKKLSLPYC